MKFKNPVKLGELVKAIDADAEILGNADRMVTGVSDVRAATKGDITFAENRKFLSLALSGPASVVLIGAEVRAPEELPENRTLVRVAHAQDALNKIACSNLTSQETPPLRGIHETAVISATAKIDDSCAIGPYCSVGANTSIRSGTILRSNAVIEDNCRIGEGCDIGSHTVIHSGCLLGDQVIVEGGSKIGTNPAYYYKIGNEIRIRQSFGTVEVGSNVVVGSNCTIDRGISGDTTIGDQSKLDNQVHVGHDVRIGKRVRIAALTGIAGYAELENDVIVRGHVGIMQYVKIGKNAELLGMSGVDLDVQEGQTVFGVPATTRERFAQRRRLLRKRIRKLEKQTGQSLSSDRGNTELRVLHAIADVAGKPVTDINLNQTLSSDLHFDSLELVELQIAIEEEFDLDMLQLRLDNHSFDNVNTVNDIISVVRKSIVVY